MSINPSTNLTRLLSADRIREVETHGNGNGNGTGLGKAASGQAFAGIVVTRRRPGHFVALTEDGRIDAILTQTGKLGSLLEKRGSINVNQAQTGAGDCYGPLSPAPTVKTIDPCDVAIAMPAADGEPAVSDADRDAWQKFRLAYDATIETPPYTVKGTLMLLPSQDPLSLTERGTELFLAVFNPTVELLGMAIKDIPQDSILVNRSHIRRIKATMAA
jgi:hypothetical protein